MKDTRIIMGMPIEIELPAADVAASKAIEAAFSYLVSVEEQFSIYKETSEISRINRGELPLELASREMQEVFAIAEKTKRESGGYFDIFRPASHPAPGGQGGRIDPSGIVKGWAIRNVAELLRKMGHEDYFVNAGGDIAMGGHDAASEEWSVGIRNPFNIHEIVKVVYPRGKGIATSGSYIRGAHIYNPHAPEDKLEEIVSITVIGPDVLEADRFATAAFAMGKEGTGFIEHLPGFEGYAIDAHGTATMTSGFAAYTSR